MKTLTIKQMIKKAKNCFVWVVVYDGDGEYIRVSKTALNFPNQFIDNFDKEKFVLREDGDLYVN
jgi:predicted ATP-dependent endonuclease of OLD family